jgi:glucose-6-phosphate dehydrogenase assembly protein OpcA
MAQALDLPLPTRRLEWSGEYITVARVVAELARLHGELARQEAESRPPDTHPHSRNCVLNLVALAGHAQHAELASGIAQKLGGVHPLRSVVVELGPLSGNSRINAEILICSNHDRPGSPIDGEHLRLTVQGPSSEHLPSLIEPLLLADVTGYLWWLGSPPLRESSLHRTLEIVDCLIVDSAAFERPLDSFLDLAGLADSLAGQGLGVADFHWIRLLPWRETIARFFAPAGRQSLLHGISALGVDYVGEHRGNRVAAALLAGWLGSSLGWRLKRATGGAGGIVVVYAESERRHPIEIAFRSVTADGLAQGELTAVRIEAASSGQTATLAVERDLEKLNRASVQFELGGAERLTEVNPMPVWSEGQLLASVLIADVRDPVHRRSLRSAAGLLRALK